MDLILSLGHKIFYFIVLISVLVIVHEWGHFIVARWCGVRVEAFSLFFGKVLWKRMWRGTEWRLSAIPFGGYVKMLGQSDLGSDQNEAMYREKALEELTGKPHEEITEHDAAALDASAIAERAAQLKSVSFAHKSVWQRSAIVFAGPLMNVVLTVMIFTAMFFVGYPTMTTLVGDVTDGGAADLAGLRPGDRVTAIDGRELTRWDDMSRIVEDSAGKPLVFDVARGDETLSLTVTPEAGRKKNVFQFEEDAGVIGIAPDGYMPVVGVRDPASIAALAGLRTGDLVKSANGRAVHYFDDLEREVARANGELTITVERGGLALEEKDRKPESAEVRLAVAAGTTTAALGIERGDLYVFETVPDSAAVKAGVRTGDRIVSVDGVTIGDWSEFSKKVKESPNKPLELVVERAGVATTLAITPDVKQEKDLLGDIITYGRAGIYPWISHSAAEMVDERYVNPFKAVARGVEMTVYWSVLTVQGFVYLMTGDVSVKSLGGPIMIADLAGKSAEVGIFSFLFTIAILSINLAILNLLPIPVLDGGHLMIFTVEAIFRRPLPEKGLRWVTNFGLALVGGLMLTVIFNDIARIFPGLRTLFGLLD